MKTPTAKKLPSGSWFVRVMIDGKSINITKTTKKEAEQEAMALKSKAKAVALSSGKTVAEAVADYIELRTSLSPSTIRRYRQFESNYFQSVMHLDIAEVTKEQWQKAVNLEKKNVSAKTLKNAWGFMSSVITESTGRKIKVTLPQVIANEAKYISSANLKKFMEAARDNRYAIAIYLGLSGLRRSEILNVRWNDIDLENDCIWVRGAAVLDENDVLVHKEENKNSSSRRCVPFIIPQLREAVLAADKTKSEYAVVCHPNVINANCKRICEQAGIPVCTCHGLRKSFASMMLVDLKLPEDLVMEAGGWSDPGTMHKIYTQVSRENLSKAGKKYTKLFSKL